MAAQQGKRYIILDWHEQQRITLLCETYVTHVDAREQVEVVYLDHGGPLAV